MKEIWSGISHMISVVIAGAPIDETGIVRV